MPSPIPRTSRHRVRAAADRGFAGIEIVPGDSGASSLSRTSAAHGIRKQCATLKLHIFSLRPLENLERCSSPLKHGLELAKKWIGLARVLRSVVYTAQELVARPNLDICINSFRVASRHYSGATRPSEAESSLMQTARRGQRHR
ncbi:4-hydroxyphenylpyruvate [Paraphaeosphaeria minitans]|uniref:4-hydroxyphenylpyruvate n=1 Tax=Paraphaeosphaeria minitans TaxID=565426 RepID=A0A9P6GHL4_9PLEO|nr:4-hydroxyphenylpyruvate [Paraphaeosphaeria minitans]